MIENSVACVQTGLFHTINVGTIYLIENKNEKTISINTKTIQAIQKQQKIVNLIIPTCTCIALP